MLEVTSLDAGYGRIKALNAVTLSIAKGEFVGLLGANNAGKSTTINCLSGVVPARGGRMVFEGCDFTGWATHKIIDLGIAQVPEGRQIFPQMTVHENLLMGGISGRANPNRARRLDYVVE